MAHMSCTQRNEMERNAISTQCGGQPEENLNHLQGVQNAESRIFPQCGAVFEKCKIVADHYGHEPQSRMLQEEAAELIQAVNKYYRSASKDGFKSGEAADNMIEEMADVLIMIIQELMFLKTDPELFLDLVDMKLDRQIKRMEDEV
nr:MAG TPA: nucleoside triphosphate pyrophosphohydrolase [Caudoviricetes sp.]